MNLVASDFKRRFTSKEVTLFVKCFHNRFYVPSGRKRQLVKFLQEALNPGDSAPIPPNPTNNSWSAWFDCAVPCQPPTYHFLFADFIQDVNLCKPVTSDSLLRLEEVYHDQSFMKRLQVQLAFLKVKAPTLMAYLNYFQERVPHVTQAHGKMERLLHYISYFIFTTNDIGLMHLSIVLSGYYFQ